MFPHVKIEQFCALQQRRGTTRLGGCATALPLSKKNIILTNNANNTNNTNSANNTNNTNTNNTNTNNITQYSCPNLRNKMQYAQYVRIHGGTQKSTSATKKICLIAGPSFTY
jgi:hypothetical protein